MQGDGLVDYEEKEEPEVIMQYFCYGHLRASLQDISRPFSELADQILHSIKSNPERTVALRKLLESKDAAVRAFITGNKT